MNDTLALLDALKGMTKKQIESMALTDLTVGSVVSVDPLQIRVSDKLTLTNRFLYLSTAVVDHNVYMTVDHLTEKRESVQGSDPDYRSHDHPYKGKKRFFIHNGLKVGEKVILLRMTGGQRYYVLDRIRYGNESDTD